MKFFIVAFAVIAAAAATSISTDYLPPVDNNIEVVAESVDAPIEQGLLSDDGYRYKTVRRLKLRHRRDVNELSNEYLPPVAESAPQEVVVEAAPSVESAVLADDGYRYKTVRKVIRRRRDVSEIANDYLPPVAEATQEIAIEVPAVESAPLADDGYRYKTVRRVIRRRRDVNELSNEYLPPVAESAPQEVVVEAAPSVESAVLADDGYRYKTVRRVIRRRRDVNELSNEYLPPVAESATQEVVVEAAPSEESAVLADDGYRYKTVRRVIRRRRDVNELPTNEYLPPVAEATQEIAIEVPAVESAALADDGYRYKTVRRLKLRHRRDVNELSNEYLPPVAESATQEVVVEAAPSEETAVLADDGYRYKTVRRVIRRRRDVNELSNEYLPPVAESAPQEVVVEAAPSVESAVLADDGYRYKTVRKVIRRRRDVSEIANDYLPPVAEATQEIAIEVPAVESAPLADDGYRYKTVRRVIRRRRDVNELSNEYLPPVAESATQEVVVEAAPSEESAVLADDGYRYKTVRRVIRRRRDVSELSNEYLPPVEQAPAASAIIDVPAEATVLADDGYRYKTVRRLKLRRH